MTLKRQLFLILTALFVGLLVTSLTVSLVNARQHLKEQMGLHTLDTATSLAFSINNAIAEGKTASIDPIVKTIFERGFYSSIVYRDTQGKVLLEYHKPPSDSGVPDWFIAALPVDIPRSQADVLSGWSQIGTIECTANADIGYQSLWVAFREQLALFSVVFLLTLLLCNAGLKISLKPLQQLEQQAEAICERHFIEQQPLPQTRELRLVVQAINRMSRKLKVTFQEQLALTDSLRAQSHLDPVTGLSNRREFNARLQAVTDSETGNGGCLMILQVNHFGRYNLQYGHEAGDECLRTIAAQLQTLTSEAPDAIISRRAGADFAIYLPRLSMERARILAERLIAQLATLDVLHDHEIHIGAACCEILRADHRLLSEADLALRQAQACGHSNWHLHEEGDVAQVAREARQWYTTLNKVLQDRSLTFHYQPVFRQQENSALAAEIFCRITMQEKLVTAGIFLPMAERFNMAEAFDRLIIDEIRVRCENASSQAAKCGAPLSINLSPQSVRSTEFIAWLSGYLGEHQKFASRLIIETSEYLVRTGATQVRMLCDMLHRHGAKLSLDHFGIHSAAFGYLHSLPLDYLKIDQSFIRDIHLNSDNQFYVQSLVQIAHSCEITILAEGVENAQEWECLCHLGIDGGQGYFLGRPDSQLSTTRS